MVEDGISVDLARTHVVLNLEALSNFQVVSKPAVPCLFHTNDQS